jgi:hypothetical protein
MKLCVGTAIIEKIAKDELDCEPIKPAGCDL